MSQRTAPRRLSAGGEAVRQAERARHALVHVLMQKAFSASPGAGAFYYLLSSLLRSRPIAYDAGVGVAATDGERIYVGPLFARVVGERGWKTAALILLHEALHIMYGHHARMALAEDPELYNIVADLYINTILETRFSRLPSEFVTLRSFISFIQGRHGGRLTGEQRRALEELAGAETVDKISVEVAYNTLLGLGEDIVNSVKERFRRGAFFGKDLAGWRRPLPERRVEGECNLREAVLDGKNIMERLREARERLEKIREELSTALGEYKALRDNRSPPRGARPGSGYGTLPGVLGRAEYEVVSRLLVPLETLFLSEVEAVMEETRVDFSQNDESAYWLPRLEDARLKRLLMLLDTSPSVPDSALKLMIALAFSAVEQYGLEAEITFFSVGPVGSVKVTPREVPERVQVKRGGGTVWDGRIAEIIRREDNKLIAVLSDFHIGLTADAYVAVREFKNRGGRLVCYSTTNTFLDFCDVKVVVPVHTSRRARRRWRPSSQNARTTRCNT